MLLGVTKSKRLLEREPTADTGRGRRLIASTDPANAGQTGTSGENRDAKPSNESPSEKNQLLIGWNNPSQWQPMRPLQALRSAGS